eukprot:4790583-Prymnesium_polylepis.1
MSSGHGPKRNAPAPAPKEREWVEGKDEPCALCLNDPIDIGGSGPGKHLRTHCRNFKPFGGGGKGTGQSGRRGSGKAAGQGATSAGADWDCPPVRAERF